MCNGLLDNDAGSSISVVRQILYSCSTHQTHERVHVKQLPVIMLVISCVVLLKLCRFTHRVLRRTYSYVHQQHEASAVIRSAALHLRIIGTKLRKAQAELKHG